MRNKTMEKRVYVYFNLHKKVWSIRQNGIVIEHTNEIKLRDCKFLVSQKGRQRVIKEQRKNVHAGVSGYIVPNIPDFKLSTNVHYNPYKYETFVDKNNKPILTSDYCILNCNNTRTVTAINPN